jgi:hypothetical protein
MGDDLSTFDLKKYLGGFMFSKGLMNVESIWKGASA